MTGADDGSTLARIKKVPISITTLAAAQDLTKAELDYHTRDIKTKASINTIATALGANATLVYSLTGFTNFNVGNTADDIKLMFPSATSNADAVSRAELAGMKPAMSLAELNSFISKAFTDNPGVFTGIKREHLSIKIQTNAGFSIGYDGTTNKDIIVDSSTTNYKLVSSLYS